MAFQVFHLWMLDQEYAEPTNADGSDESVHTISPFQVRSSHQKRYEVQLFLRISQA